MGLLRLFLAAVVALGHFQICILLPLNAPAAEVANYLKLGHDAGHAVIFFYVISGFLISYALEHKYKTDSLEFYKARFLRIFPLYWFLYGLMIVFDYAGAAQNIKNSPVLDWLPGLLLFGSDWAVSFLHYPASFMEEFPAFLRPAWSLGAEVTFYALAPYLLVKYKKLGLAVLVASVGIRGVIVYQLGFDETWSLHFFPATLMFFLLGHFSRSLYRKLGRHLGAANHLWLAMFFGLSLCNVTTGLPFDGVIFYLELVGLVCSLPFLFERTKDIRWMNILGDQSYPLYLSHLLTMSLLAFVPTLIIQMGESDQALLAGVAIEYRFVLYAAAFLAAAVLVSFLLHYLVEQPLSTLGAQVLMPRSRGRDAAAISWRQLLDVRSQQLQWHQLELSPAALWRTPANLAPSDTQHVLNRVGAGPSLAPAVDAGWLANYRAAAAAFWPIAVVGLAIGFARNTKRGLAFVGASWASASDGHAAPIEAAAGPVSARLGSIARAVGLWWARGRKASRYRSVVLPCILAAAMVASAEAVLWFTYHPSFWQKTTWLMHDPYRSELFDRFETYVRLSHFEKSEPDIISVGDSSGFFSLQSTVVNRYLGGPKYLSLNTGANQAYSGYQGIAEYMLQRSSKTKYVVLYVFPQLLPQDEVIQPADLGPITYDDLVGAKSYMTPPSAFLSPYAKSLAFEGRSFHFGEPLSQHLPSLQLVKTVDDTLGWLPEFDWRWERLDRHVRFYSDERMGWQHRLGLTDPSAINANLDEFDKAVRRYGAQLVVAFAPISRRAIAPDDANIIAADQALERFQREHPDVKFLFPLITPWGIEKFGMFNHISREYAFLSSERLGAALARLVRDPNSIPPYTAQFKLPAPHPPVRVRPLGPPDTALRSPALALYLYSSTDDPKYGELFSRRVADLLAKEPSFGYAMADLRARNASLAQRNIKLAFDLSEIRATPVEVTGLPHCSTPSGQPIEWVQLDGTMIFTYEAPGYTTKEPVAWPQASHILIPTVVEDGVRKFDGYCPEPSMHQAAVALH